MPAVVATPPPIDPRPSVVEQRVVEQPAQPTPAQITIPQSFNIGKLVAPNAERFFEFGKEKRLGKAGKEPDKEAEVKVNGGEARFRESHAELAEWKTKNPSATTDELGREILGSIERHFGPYNRSFEKAQDTLSGAGGVLGYRELANSPEKLHEAHSISGQPKNLIRELYLSEAEALRKHHALPEATEDLKKIRDQAKKTLAEDGRYQDKAFDGNRTLDVTKTRTGETICLERGTIAATHFCDLGSPAEVLSVTTQQKGGHVVVWVHDASSGSHETKGRVFEATAKPGSDPWRNVLKVEGKTVWISGTDVAPSSFTIEGVGLQTSSRVWSNPVPVSAAQEGAVEAILKEARAAAKIR